MLFSLPFYIQEIDTVEHNYYTHTCVVNLTGNLWFIGIFSYKALLLIFGLFLAWQTKNVQLPGLNDSKLIALSVYNVVIFVTILFPLYVFLPKWMVEMKNNIVSFLMMFCPSVVLMVIFLPKVIIPFYFLHSFLYSLHFIPFFTSYIK